MARKSVRGAAGGTGGSSTSAPLQHQSTGGRAAGATRRRASSTLRWGSRSRSSANTSRLTNRVTSSSCGCCTSARGALNLPLAIARIYPYSSRATTDLHALSVSWRQACRRGLLRRSDRLYLIMPIQLQSLPLIQNWDCHTCGDCCRTLEAVITDEEKHRIEALDLADDPEVAPKPWFAPWVGAQELEAEASAWWGLRLFDDRQPLPASRAFRRRRQAVRMPFVPLPPHTSGQSLARRHAFLLPVGRSKFGPPGGRR